MATMTTNPVEVATMKVAQIASAGGDFQIVERTAPNPGAGQVRIQVQACGICHTDVLTKEGLWPGLRYPTRSSIRAHGVTVCVWACVALVISRTSTPRASNASAINER